ncbi:MAG: DNA-directed RNA polymerase subunit alpha [candidate division WOR-3 bacterium]
MLEKTYYLKHFIILEKVEVEKETQTDSYTKFFIEPLERGWGHTIGTALRRSLLSSVQGAAITQVKIDGVAHEFSSIPDVLEDVPQIILNLKKVRLRLNSEVPKTCYLYTEKEGEYKAKDLQVPPEVIIANPEQPILTLTADKKLKMEMRVENGRGYVPAEKLRKVTEEVPIGTIFLDAFFSPVKKVNYQVETMQYLERTDLERIILEIWTDGTVAPEEALIQAANILRNSFEHLIPKETALKFLPEERPDREKERLREILVRDVEDLELSNRAINCLKNGRYKDGGKVNVRTIGDLVQLTEKEILNIENFGKKSLEELKNTLEKWGLSLGMDVSDILKDIKKEDETQKES